MNGKLIKKYFSVKHHHHKKHVALILSGCGYADGSEIQETSAIIFNLSKLNIMWTAYSFDMNQTHVINHNNQSETLDQPRNMLIESARITRTKVENLSKLHFENYQGVVIPGGFGAAKNLSNFAFENENFTVNEILEKKLIEFHKHKIPIASCCISPLLLARIFGKNNNIHSKNNNINHKGPGIEITLGMKGENWKYSDTIILAEKLGNKLFEVDVTECHTDHINKIITSPAYMKDNATPHEVFTGIEKMINSLNKLMH